MTNINKNDKIILVLPIPTLDLQFSGGKITMNVLPLDSASLAEKLGIELGRVEYLRISLGRFIRREFTDISQTDLRNGFSDIMNRVFHGNEIFRILFHGKPRALIIPPELFLLIDMTQKACSKKDKNA